MALTESDIDLLFTYHNPQHINPERFTEIRKAAKELALKILAHGGSEKDIVKSINKLRESLFYAIASIAVPPLSSDN